MKGMQFTIVALIGLMASAQARPTLVAVELADKEQIQLWLEQNYPTYRYVNGTVIAELDDYQISSAEKKGFACRVIDDSPWSEPYFIGKVPIESRSDMPGKVIWQKEGQFLVKLPQQKVLELLGLRLGFQRFTRIPLPSRYWDMVMTKLVPVKQLGWDPFIQSLVDQVSMDSITSYIQRLQDFKTRMVFTDSCSAAATWLRQKLTGWGYTTEFDSFYVDSCVFSGYWPDTGYQWNVVATKNGSTNPSKIFIIGGHYDAINWADTSLSWFYAPGADDNATGIATTLEAARILSNYAWEPTIKFIGWSAEELGLLGSDDYAQRADSAGLDIGGVLNLDMLGYMGSAMDFHVIYCDSFSSWLSDLFNHAAHIYAPSLIMYPERIAGWNGSDHYPFSARGYPSICCIERPYYMNYNIHDTTDLLSTLTPEQYTEATKISVAAIAILGLMCPGIVRNVDVLDVGDGSSLEVTWSANSEPDVIGYKVYWGLASEAYTDTDFVAGISTTADTLSGLLTDSTYYIIVRAVDADSHESFMATEIAGTPRSVPAAPSGAIATPIISGIRIDWQPNRELDFDGYRIYRRLNENPVYDSLNTLLLNDTTFTNAPLFGENKYYYAIRAFDIYGNASPMSSEAYGRPITLDQGILLVDETRNGTNPPDSLQDVFYHYIMTGYQCTDYEYGSVSQKPVLADFVPYSTVIWHADDNTELMASGNVSDLQSYCDVGGKLWFIGWKPTANLCNSLIYPKDFTYGSFIYDCLKIEHADISSATDSFQAATGSWGYPQLDIDSAKVPIPSWHGTLRYIEALTSVTPGQDIYAMDMKNDNSPFEGAFCGVRYLGPDFRAVFFGFPLYFMNQGQARVAAQKVMEDFGEMHVSEDKISPSQNAKFGLVSIMPNPSNRILTIRYNSPGAHVITIRLYDVTGIKVKTLFTGETMEGRNEITLVLRDLSSGVYFVQIKTEGYCTTEKIILLK